MLNDETSNLIQMIQGIEKFTTEIVQNKVFWVQEALATAAIKPCVRMFVNVALIKQFLEYFLNCFFVVLVSCSYELVIFNV